MQHIGMHMYICLIMVLLKGNSIPIHGQRVATEHLQVILAILIMCMWVPGRFLLVTCHMCPQCVHVLSIYPHVCHKYPEQEDYSSSCAISNQGVLRIDMSY